MGAKYRWKITRDKIDDGRAVGIEGPRDLDPTIKANPTPFTLHDDDGILYYHGMIYGEFDGFEPLDDFGMGYAGCTGIKYKGEWL